MSLDRSRAASTAASTRTLSPEQAIGPRVHREEDDWMLGRLRLGLSASERPDEALDRRVPQRGGAAAGLRHPASLQEADYMVSSTGSSGNQTPRSEASRISGPLRRASHAEAAAQPSELRSLEERLQKLEAQVKAQVGDVERRFRELLCSREKTRPVTTHSTSPNSLGAELRAETEARFASTERQLRAVAGRAQAELQESLKRAEEKLVRTATQLMRQQQDQHQVLLQKGQEQLAGAAASAPSVPDHHRQQRGLLMSPAPPGAVECLSAPVLTPRSSTASVSGAGTPRRALSPYASTRGVPAGGSARAPTTMFRHWEGPQVPSSMESTLNERFEDMSYAASEPMTTGGLQCRAPFTAKEPSASPPLQGLVSQLRSSLSSSSRG